MFPFIARQRLKNIFETSFPIMPRLLSTENQFNEVRSRIYNQHINISNKWYSQAEWDSIMFRRTIYPNTIMKHCFLDKKLLTAKSLMAYLKCKNITPNTRILNLFLKLCSKCAVEGGLESIADIYDDLTSTRLEYNVQICNMCIIALTETKLWANGINLMKLMQVNKNNPSEDAFNALICAAFRNKKFEVGYEILNVFKGSISNEILNEWLDLCNDDCTMNTIYKFVDYLSSNALQIPMSINEKVKLKIETKGYNVNHVKINSDRFCNHCKNYLRQNELLDEDFASLLKAVMNLIKGKDLFHKTNPDELNKFQKFVKKNSPWDIVIDGLNAAYVGTIKTESELAGQLVKVIKKLNEVKKQKILILGTKQMSGWPKEDLFYLSMNSDYFTTTSQTVDDVFLLYAALASGSGTMFVSNDFMADHKLRLQNDRLTTLFQNWQRNYQIRVFKNNRSGIELMLPKSCKLTAQRTKKTIHIPYSIEHESTTTIDNIQDKWFCCKKENQK